MFIQLYDIHIFLKMHTQKCIRYNNNTLRYTFNKLCIIHFYFVIIIKIYSVEGLSSFSRQCPQD